MVRSQRSSHISSARLAVCFVLLCAVVQFGCGGSSSSSQTVVSVNVTPATSSVSVNGQQQFTATALDSNGTTVSGQTFTWTSSNTSAAKIDASGIATGVAPGSTQITALTAGITSTAVTLTVNPSIATVSISPTTATIKVGATQQFTASAVDAQGNAVSDAVFSWHNSFGGVASIDSHGLATGLSPGTVLITASANGVTSPVATLTVTQ
ncbi:MAG TPA: Ig-like domain-containing protein [Terriglobales bacterium]|nr:Ig-like domain-containing protein [Terriglobales bacterium]